MEVGDVLMTSIITANGAILRGGMKKIITVFVFALHRLSPRTFPHFSVIFTFSFISHSLSRRTLSHSSSTSLTHPFGEIAALDFTLGLSRLQHDK